jgi:Putative prokaryotic signal transducing protein
MRNPIHPELVVVGTYPDELAANLAKTALEAAGIEAMVRNDSASQYPAVLGFELLVTSDDAAQAREILSGL